MSRRNQKPHHKPAALKQNLPPTGPRDLGLKALHGANYKEAIRIWSELDAADDPAVRAAIAEAHFRRALATRLSVDEALTDLRRALELCPDEARFWYQYGLMLHRNDSVEEARKAYARAAELGHARKGLGVVRGLAELEADPSLSLDTLTWLTPEARATLVPIADLLRGETGEESEPPVHDDTSRTLSTVDPIASLWRGLTLLKHGKASEAYTALLPVKGQRLPIGAEATRAFYFGVAASLAGKPNVALSAWQEMMHVPSAVAALPPRIQTSLSQISRQSILDLQQAGQWQEALKQVLSAIVTAPDDRWLLQALLVSANQLAEKARAEANWDRADDYWQLMRGKLEKHPDLGPLPPILHNLAIANEALEEWEEAALTWVALLNTLPKRTGRASKTPAPTSEGPTVEERRVWMRRRILDNYKRADLPDEAIAYYKQAVKADPENLDLRLEMASALLANDQTIAARNEVQRILDKDPKQIDALLVLAEIYRSRDEEHLAEKALIRILEIDPQHDTTRKALRQMTLERGMYFFNMGMYRQAQENYTAALKYAPNDPQLLVFLGQAALVLGAKKEAQAHFDAALATGEPEAYFQLFFLWGRSLNELEARKILQQAESDGFANSHFLIRAGMTLLTHIASGPPGRPRSSPVPPLWEKWGRDLIEQGLDTAPDRGEALENLIRSLGPGHIDLAVGYARQLIALRPDDPEIYLKLAVYQGIAHDVAGAKATLTQAERLVRKLGRKDLIDKIAKLRREIGSPMFGMLGSLIASGELDLEDLEDGEFF